MDVAKGELTILRCRAIADVLRKELDIKTKVTAHPQENTITVEFQDGTTLVLRPISISPVK